MNDRFESEKYYCLQPTGRREPWERGFRAPCQNMADGIDLTDFFARLRNSLLDLSRRLQCNASEDTLDFVSFRLQQILQHLVHFEAVWVEYRNPSQTLGRLV